jgi:hypothetical protein
VILSHEEDSLFDHKYWKMCMLLKIFRIFKQ